MCLCGYCRQSEDKVKQTGLLLGYPECCVAEFIRDKKPFNEREPRPEGYHKKREQLGNLYQEELTWFYDTQVLFGKDPLKSWVGGCFEQYVGLKDFGPCFECQLVVVHQFLEGTKMGLEKKEAFCRAANMIITKKRVWPLDYCPPLPEIRKYFK